MELKVIREEKVATRLSARWGNLQDDETLLDLIRAEVTAHRSCLRWTSLRRLERALDAGAEKTRERLRSLCDSLEYEGDLTVSSGGVLHVSPVRAIEIQKGVHRIVCSLPSRQLGCHLPGELKVEGMRRLHCFDTTQTKQATAAVQALGGVIVAPQVWAGLDLAPIADGGWLESLEQRLEWHGESAGSLESDGRLDWQSLVLSADGPRWRRETDDYSRLWRARTPYGRWLWAWGPAQGTPSTEKFVSLFADDANRTLYALARTANQPVSAILVRYDLFAHLGISEWLPRAEYRYLSSLASVSRNDHLQQWVIPLTRVDDVRETLSRRLGIDIIEEAPTRANDS